MLDHVNFHITENINPDFVCEQIINNFQELWASTWIFHKDVLIKVYKPFNGDHMNRKEALEVKSFLNNMGILVD